MATVEEIARRIANEEPWPTRAERERAASPEDSGTSWVPNRKVLAAALTSVIVYVAGRYGVELDADLTATVTGLVTLAVAYLIPEKS